ncbi:unnamed protein product [Caretta caretta]
MQHLRLQTVPMAMVARQRVRRTPRLQPLLSINGACRLYEQHEALEIERDKRTWDKHGSSRFCVGAFLLAGSVRFPRF